MSGDGKYTFLDFFAGSGLVAEGVKQYFKTMWANDNSHKKAEIYVANHTDENFHLKTIEEVHGSNVPPAVVSWASFPCQDLSLAGNLEGIQGRRSSLVWHWLRVMDEMPQKPPIVVAENVVGLVSANGGAYYMSVHNALTKRGYNVGAVQLNSSHWVPQSRPRIFVIGMHKNINTEDLKYDQPYWPHTKAIRRVAGKLVDFVWWKLPEQAERATEFSDIVDFREPYHNKRQSAYNLALLSERHRAKLHEYSRKRSGTYAAPGYKRTRSGRQFLELRFDGLAGCLRTSGGGSSRQFIVARTEDGFRTRLITVREAARLMGAPEEYKLPKNYNDGYSAMGDAVAVPVARFLAQYLLYPAARKCKESF